MAWDEINNDTRGWIMALVSGAACVLGSSVICVDCLIRLIPSKRDFSIHESNVFLASSLSLSFGVMLFSALYSMLPTAKRYFLDAEYPSQTAGLLVIAWFACGFIGIQIVSRLLHRFMPSHVVDCDHTHEPHSHHEHGYDHDHGHGHHSHHHSPARHHSPQSLPRVRNAASIPSTIEEATLETEIVASESTPLLVHLDYPNPELPPANGNGASIGNGNGYLPGTDGTPDGPPPSRRCRSLSMSRRRSAPAHQAQATRRPPMAVHERVMSFVRDLKSNCDETGPCYGYSDPCGQECFKHVNHHRAPNTAQRISLVRTCGGAYYATQQKPGDLAEFHGEDPESAPVSPIRGRPHPLGAHGDMECRSPSPLGSTPPEDVEAQHHHHVPTNAFLSIGLQTAIAITLHKFPEGFITYATNHASPDLGFNVFMALFVHNISEGFTIALPLYMALGSRARAMLWASLLGGLSQPIGAGVAALWFRVAEDRSSYSPDVAVYGGLFAVTAGIMVSVALQLFVESLSLNHDRNLSLLFAFVGMLVLGLSNALVGEH